MQISPMPAFPRELIPSDDQRSCLPERKYPSFLQTLLLSQLQPLEFEPFAADLGKLVLRLLHKPAFLATAEDL